MGQTREAGLPPKAGRAVNPALFLVAVVCFFLPFFTVECSEALPEALEGLAEGLGEGQELDFGDQDLSQSVTGWQLVIGDPGEDGGAPGGEVEDPGPDLIAMAAFAVAVLGILLSWLRRPIGPAVGLLLGVAGVVLLIVLWNRISDRIPQEARAFVDLRTEPAFWIAVVGFALAALWAALRLLLEREGRPARGTGRARAPAAEPPP